MKPHIYRNMTDYKGEQRAVPDTSHRDLWLAYHEMVRRNDEWRLNNKGQHGTLNTKAVEQHHEIENLKQGE